MVADFALGPSKQLNWTPELMPPGIDQFFVGHSVALKAVGGEPISVGGGDEPEFFRVGAAIGIFFYVVDLGPVGAGAVTVTVGTSFTSFITSLMFITPKKAVASSPPHETIIRYRCDSRNEYLSANDCLDYHDDR